MGHLVLILVVATLVRASSSREPRFSKDCGGTFTKNEGSLSWSKEDNAPCKWTISVTEGHVIKLNFSDHFDFISPFCSQRSIHVFDIIGDHGHNRLGRWDGWELPPPLTSSGSTIEMVFVPCLQHYYKKDGFSFSWKTTERLSKDILYEPQGSFTSPDVPLFYPNNVSKRWEILAAFDEDDLEDYWGTGFSFQKFLTLKFNAFDLGNDEDESCDHGRVEISDVLFNGSLVSLGQWCGSNTPPAIKSSGSRLVVDFFSDIVDKDRSLGFNASWSVDSQCGGTLTTDKGALSSPHNPDRDKYPEKCTWIINVTENHVIKLTFLEPFRIQECKHEQSCLCNYLRIFDILPNGERYFRGAFCGEELPSSFTSSASTVEVEFHSNGDKDFFSLYWSKKVKSFDNVLEASQGTLHSPNHPLGYLDGLDKRWEILVPVGHYVILEFNAFHVGNNDDPSCESDKIEIFDALFNGNDTLVSLGQWCGSDGPPPIKSSGSRLVIDFHTDKENVDNGQGFNASWIADSKCGGNLTTGRGVLSSPNYPYKYGNDQSCKWTINVRENHVMEMSFLAPFKIEQYGSSCGKDSVKVYDVMPSGDRHLKGNFCGQNSPVPLTSSTSTVDVEFETDSHWSYQGFSLVWSERVKPPHTHVSGMGGTLTSFNFVYPSKNSSNEDAGKRWEISAQFGQHVALEFNSFDLGVTDSGCYQDSVEIFDVMGNNSLLSLGKWCGSVAPPEIKSSGSRLVLDFNADDDSRNNGPGFNISLNADSTCGGNLKGDKGLISSPNYPNDYANNQFCKWTFSVNDGHFIELSFLPPFDFGFCYSKCGCDSLKMFDVMPNGDRYLRGAWCGGDLPSSSLSWSSTIDVEFKSNGFNTFAGFSAVWKKIVKKTDAIIVYGSQGSITSLSHSSTYPDNVDQRWEIIGSLGQFITLEFNMFDLDNRQNNKSCSNDRIEIFDLMGNNSLLSLGQWCGSVTPPAIKSSGSKLVIDFHTDEDSKNNGQGFNISWTAEYGCGGTFTSDTGLISSPYYPYYFTEDTTCSWSITVEQGYLIQLTFLEPFHIAACESCRCNSVKIYEKTNYLRAAFCGDKIPSQWTSSSSTIKVEFLSKFPSFGEGFSVTWSKVANPFHRFSLFSHYHGIKSPKYPSAYPENLTKRWELIAPPEKYISLTFKKFDLGKTDGKTCNKDRIEIFDVFANNSLFSLGQWCGDRTPPYLKSSGSKLFLDFHTDNDSTNNGKGFKADWYQSVDCGGTMTADKGILATPNYPDINHKFQTCKWKIKTTSGYVIKLTFLEPFYMRYCYSCQCQVVKVYDILPNGERYLRLIWCGQDVSQHLISLSQAVEIEYVFVGTTAIISQYAVGDKFSLSWSKVKENVNRFIGMEGVLTSSQPSIYSDNVNNKRWEILVPYNQHVMLEFNTFDLSMADDTSCSKDRIEIFDVISNNSLLSLGQWCGSVAPPPIKSSGSRLVVDFHADDYKSNGQGFNASWNADYKCGGTYKTDRGWLTAPDISHKFCKWTISVTTGHVIAVTFLPPFGLGKYLCQSDSVKIYDVLPNGNRSLKGIWCGNDIPPPLISSSSTIDVEYNVNPLHITHGFSLTWSKNGSYSPAVPYKAPAIPDCGEVFNASTGFFNSPGFPNNYPNDLDCVWDLNTKPGERIKLKFKWPFDLEWHHDCRNDYIEVLDYFSNGTTISQGKVCGKKKTPVFYSMSSRLTVKFHSDFSKSGKGFNASWESEKGCGGIFHQEKGYLISPNYPSLYPTNKICRWKITPVGGRKIIIRFNPLFDVQYRENCYRDYVKVIQGKNVQTFCGNRTPPMITGFKTIKVKFRSDRRKTARGFFASWTSE